MLEGQIAIVTGGGIGRATCLTFASEGTDIVIPKVNIANAKATAEKIIALGRQGLTMVIRKRSIYNSIA